LDIPDVTEDGSQAHCPECRSRFTVCRESFGGRALRKTGTITCAACGEQLGPDIHCAGCGALFPDYLYTSTGRKKKRAVQKVKLDITIFPERKRQAVSVPRIDAAVPQAPKSKGGTKAAGGGKRLTQVAAALVLLLVVGAGGAYFYRHHQSGKELSKNVVLQIYFTRIGEKKSIEACNKIAADWKAKGDQGVAPPAPVNDVRDLESIHAKVDGLVPKVSRRDAPEDLRPVLDKLDRLRAAYDRAHKLATAPSGNIVAYTAAATTADNEYRAAARDLKAALPPEVIESIKTAGQRYKGMQGFLEL